MNQNITFNDICELNNKFKFVPKRNVEVLAFIRFAKEELTFKQCLNSLLPNITKGVLVYHDQPSDSFVDISETLEIAKEFCHQNPGFKLIHYPHVVYRANSKKYLGVLGKDFQLENRLDAFYNFALEELKKLAKTSDPYLLKVDGDHIYDAKSIAEQIKLLNESPVLIDELVLPKVNVAYLPELDKLYFLKSVENLDHFFVRANKISFEFLNDYEQQYFWEVQSPKLDYNYCIDHLIKENSRKFIKFISNIEERNNLKNQKLSLPKLFKTLVLYFDYIKRKKRLQKTFKELAFVDNLIYVEKSLPKYNSLHFHLQKYWSAPYGKMPTFEEFKNLTQAHNGKYVEFSVWTNPHNTSELSLYKSGLIDENSEPNHYLIQNYEKVIEIARSFYKK